MRVVFAIVAALSLAVVAAAASRADTAPIANSPDLPWTNPTHESELELLLSKLATQIAKKDVKVRCEGDTDWRNLHVQFGADPDSELGYVPVEYDARGRVAWIADYAELKGEEVCIPLKKFAAAQIKPTKCAVTLFKQTKVYVQRRVNGVTKRVPKIVVKKVKASVPCYLGKNMVAREMPDSYWDAYTSYAIALETVAHEAIHLGGIAGARFPGGGFVGDPNGEAKADCYGMQSTAFVAQQLGASADDAQAIATWYWDRLYPEYQGTDTWSSACRPGGGLDVRPPGKTVWP